MSKQMKAPPYTFGCSHCGGWPVRDMLDGEALCQACCDKWACGQAREPDWDRIGIAGREDAESRN